MEPRYFIAGGKQYECTAEKGEELQTELAENNNNSVLNVCRHMALCHTVKILQRNGKTVLNATSPDEVALVRSAENCGVKFVERNRSEVTIKVGEEMEHYTVHKIIDFDSDRKRMSIVVEYKTGDASRFMLLCKGADVKVEELLKDPK